MIVLRQLSEKDAPFMLEWMHDPDILKGLSIRTIDSTLDDALGFIRRSQIPDPVKTGDDLHFAAADAESDEYLGTISLKHVDLENRRAEYAVVMRKKAHGTGAAFEATRLVLEKAFSELGLHKVFLSVYADNIAAVKLYEKSGFKCEGEFRDHFLKDGRFVGWKWYSVLRGEPARLDMD